MHKRPLPEVLPVAQDVVLVREIDYFLPLRALAKASGLSTRTLRQRLSDPSYPLPHFRVGGKVLILWSEYRIWMEAFRRRAAVDVEEIAQDLIDNLKRPTRRAAHERRKVP